MPVVSPVSRSLIVGSVISQCSYRPLHPAWSGSTQLRVGTPRVGRSANPYLQTRIQTIRQSRRSSPRPRSPRACLQRRRQHSPLCRLCIDSPRPRKAILANPPQHLSVTKEITRQASAKDRLRMTTYSTRLGRRSTARLVLPGPPEAACSSTPRPLPLHYYPSPPLLSQGRAPR